MSITVAGIWEFGWSTPIKEVDLWEYALKEFGDVDFHMTPVSGIFREFVTEHADLNTLITSKRAEGIEIVFVDEAAPVSLVNFVHPANAMYVFGKASISTFAVYASPGDKSVSIPTVTNQGGFWPHQAACVVLYDRFSKG
jgi:hypothetical protein